MSVSDTRDGGWMPLVDNYSHGQQGWCTV